MVSIKIFPLVRRCFSQHISIKPKICVVGAGPAGFYAAQHLAKKLDSCEIDIYERLPVPFGLVRFGVAPDHPEVKNVEHTFTKTAENPKVKFLGNINMGKDVRLAQLIESYHIVILAYGAEENMKLNISGENLNNVFTARNIVGWYNGVPSDRNIVIDLSAENVAIFGQGNVAIDVARILLSPVDKLKNTDITQHALEALSDSKIKIVHMIGRRGPLQAAFTIKELREVLKLPNCSTQWVPRDFQGIAEMVPNLARPKKRITELMLKSLEEPSKELGKKFLPIFHRSPLEILGKNSIENVKLGVNRLIGEDILKQQAELTDGRENIECQLGIVSVGYKSVCADNLIDFDERRGIVKNNYGKVKHGLYTTGWLATGPVGVILSTMSNSFSVAEMILEDIVKDSLLTRDKPGYKAIENLLKANNVQVVKWEDWLKIDKHEIQEGKKVGKPREKITDVNKMLHIAAS